MATSSVTGRNSCALSAWRCHDVITFRGCGATGSTRAVHSARFTPCDNCAFALTSSPRRMDAGMRQLWQPHQHGSHLGRWAGVDGDDSLTRPSDVEPPYFILLTPTVVIWVDQTYSYKASCGRPG